jgi:hypothetical protein
MILYILAFYTKKKKKTSHGKTEEELGYRRAVT